jgi:hypothetical protein
MLLFAPLGPYDKSITFQTSRRQDAIRGYSCPGRIAHVVDRSSEGSQACPLRWQNRLSERKRKTVGGSSAVDERRAGF